MPNQSGNAYSLVTLCPLLPASGRDASPVALVRDSLNDEPNDERAAMAKVPNTYFCRLFVLDDVVYQGKPARSEHLKSKYLVFLASIHGDPDQYLTGMWQHAREFIQRTWKYCLGFSDVRDADGFARYLRRCQVETTLFFNGSTDESLDEQLKALYLKQEFSRFAYEHQGKSPVELQAAFRLFVEQVRPFEATPTWQPGAASLEAVMGGTT